MGNDTMSAAQEVETLIYDYGRLVFQVIYGLTGDWQESQDLTQDTFLHALRAIEAAPVSAPVGRRGTILARDREFAQSG
jgi:DNA-directed RNA polymerase specialized sigma24 family protein